MSEMSPQLRPVCKPLLAANTGPELTWVSPVHVSTKISQGSQAFVSDTRALMALVMKEWMLQKMRMNVRKEPATSWTEFNVVLLQGDSISPFPCHPFNANDSLKPGFVWPCVDGRRGSEVETYLWRCRRRASSCDLRLKAVAFMSVHSVGY